MALRQRMFADHPWDLANPEGMPTMDGKMMSAAQMFDQAGNPPMLQQKKSTAGQRKQGKERMYRDESHKAEIDAVFGSVLQRRNVVRPYQASERRETAQPDGESQRATRVKGKQARGDKAQGFVTGSLLRVTPEEFHREMRRYMPSANGKLMSPFEWFESAGRSPPPPRPPQAK